MAFKLTAKTNLLICLIIFIISLIFHQFLLETYLNFWANLPVIFGYNIFVGIPVIYGLIAVITIVHEMLHGMVFRVFGGRVRYGIKWRMLSVYCQEVSGLAIEEYKFCIVLLEPVVCISILSLLLPAWLGRVIMVFNLAGAGGDIYMVAVLLMQHRGCRIIDTDYGFKSIDKL